MSESSHVGSACVAVTRNGNGRKSRETIWDYAVMLALSELPAQEVWNQVEARYGKEKTMELLEKIRGMSVDTRGGEGLAGTQHQPESHV